MKDEDNRKDDLSEEPLRITGEREVPDLLGPKRGHPFLQVLRILLCLFVTFLLFAVLFVLGTGYTHSLYSAQAKIIRDAWEKNYRQSGEAESNAAVLKQMKNDNKRLRKAFDAYVPKGEYIVIDSINNRLYLMRGDQKILNAVCSAGSGAILVDTPSGRKWVFDTPRGEFKVLNKTENPVWKKPDWAFIEEGKPLPKNDSERYEYGMLGEYGLYFSKDGYLIHGTLYERLLGRSITHGCIRLGRDDLRVLYNSAKIGTKVYAY